MSRKLSSRSALARVVVAVLVASAVVAVPFVHTRLKPPFFRASIDMRTPLVLYSTVKVTKDR